MNCIEKKCKAGTEFLVITIIWCFTMYWVVMAFFKWIVQ